MLIPVRCFTCGKVLADKYTYYLKQVETLKNEASGSKAKPAPVVKPKKKKGADADADVADMKLNDTLITGPILDAMGLTRYCCRRHMLGTVDMMDTI
jgi:DNA-directed RNA polymerase I, II, and III subunit RPABC5